MASLTIVLNRDGQPVNTGFNSARRLKRSAEALVGIVRGLLADSELNEREVAFLATWLRENEEIAAEWPGDVVAQRVHRALEDGVVTAAELEDLTRTLAELVGGVVEETGAVDGMATRLPVDQCAALAFDGRTYCFTGKFLCGTREYCQELVIARGGQILDGITKKLDYLVIGGLASRDWAQTSYGRKIEKAMEYKGKGAKTLILAEELWQRLLPPMPT